MLRLCRIELLSAVTLERRRPTLGVPKGESVVILFPQLPVALILGYMILISDGEGEGAREEKVLETLEEAELTSQF